ncbi:MAG: c-type cytochrome domain-containing protein [Kiritimatiellia bacterium]
MPPVKMTVVSILLAAGATLGLARAEREEKEEHGREHHAGKESIAARLPPAATTKGLTFEKDIQPILETYSCTDCHGETKQKGKLRLDTLEFLKKGGAEGVIIVPGQGTKGSLLSAIARLDADDAMPPDRAPGKDVGADGKKLPPVKHVTPAEIGIIRAWIEQGAN